MHWQVETYEVANGMDTKRSSANMCQTRVFQSSFKTGFALFSWHFLETLLELCVHPMSVFFPVKLSVKFCCCFFGRGREHPLHPWIERVKV